jgi:hypothetical protein
VRGDRSSPRLGLQLREALRSRFRADDPGEERRTAVYPEYRDQIESDGQSGFSTSRILAENALHVGTWVLAGFLLSPLRLHGWPVLSLAWAALVLVVQVLLKKHNCSGCFYYGRTCHLGWGKVAARMFPQDSGSRATGMHLSLFYVLSPPLVLLGAVALGVVLPVGLLHWILLGLYVALNAASFPVRISGCRACAMRRACPGSACR